MSTVPSEPRPSPTTRLRCYLVEDSAVIRHNLIATLEEMLAVEVLGHAEDERTALDWLRHGEAAGQAACDLLIVDIFLKSGTGLEVLRQARLLRPGTRLVVLSNYATSDIRRRCAALGADRVFDKSSELEELLGYCAELLAELQRGAGPC